MKLQMKQKPVQTPVPAIDYDVVKRSAEVGGRTITVSQRQSLGCGGGLQVTVEPTTDDALEMVHSILDGTYFTRTLPPAALSPLSTGNEAAGLFPALATARASHTEPENRPSVPASSSPGFSWSPVVWPAIFFAVCVACLLFWEVRSRISELEREQTERGAECEGLRGKLRALEEQLAVEQKEHATAITHLTLERNDAVRKKDEFEQAFGDIENAAQLTEKLMEERAEKTKGQRAMQIMSNRNDKLEQEIKNLHAASALLPRTAGNEPDSNDYAATDGETSVNKDKRSDADAKSDTTEDGTNGNGAGSQDGGEEDGETMTEPKKKKRPRGGKNRRKGPPKATGEAMGEAMGEKGLSEEARALQEGE